MEQKTLVLRKRTTTTPFNNDPLKNLLRDFFGVGTTLLDTMPVRYFLPEEQSYPRYDVIDRSIEGKTNSIEIRMALAGWSKEDLEITSKDGYLVVSGIMNREGKPVEDVSYYRRGISAKDFEWSGKMPEDSVVGGISLTDGILSIKVSREIPEVEKTKTYKIT